jgi:hypothetical protein
LWTDSDRTEFDNKFDADEDVIELLDLTTAHRPKLATKRVNVDFPKIDSSAARSGGAPIWCNAKR